MKSCMINLGMISILLIGTSQFQNLLKIQNYYNKLLEKKNILQSNQQNVAPEPDLISLEVKLLDMVG